MKIKPDFDTPNEPPTPQVIHPRTRRRSSNVVRPTCPFCYQSGVHRSATQCLRALERTSSN
jgi:hypothetical protein